MPHLFTSLFEFYGVQWQMIASKQLKQHWISTITGLTPELISRGWNRCKRAYKTPPTAEEFKSLCLRPEEAETTESQNKAITDVKNTNPVVPYYPVEYNATHEEIDGIPDDLKPRPWPFTLEDAKKPNFYDQLRKWQEEETHREYYAKKLGYNKCSNTLCGEWGKMVN